MCDMYSDKISRVLYISSMLMRGQILKKKELVQDIGVSARSIQRDLENIRDFLDKKYVKEGYGSQLIYNYHEKGYCLEEYTQLRLSYDEVLAISKILLESRAFTKREMMYILDKLIEDYIPWESRAAINDMLNNERFHYIELCNCNAFLDKLTPLSQAIRENRIIRIKYDKLEESATVERRLEPLAILFSEYYFYLVGFIENMNKTETFENSEDIFPTIYRIDQIQHIEVLEEHFRIPYANRFEEGEYRKHFQYLYDGKPQKVRFKYTGTSVESVLDYLPTARILNEENGVYLMEAEVFGKGIDMWVRSQGDNITEFQVI